MYSKLEVASQKKLEVLKIPQKTQNARKNVSTTLKTFLLSVLWRVATLKNFETIEKLRNSKNAQKQSQK